MVCFPRLSKLLISLSVQAIRTDVINEQPSEDASLQCAALCTVLFCNLSATCEPRLAQSADLEECILIVCSVVDGEED